jgi:hypothetical protein
MICLVLANVLNNNSVSSLYLVLAMCQAVFKHMICTHLFNPYKSMKWVLLLSLLYKEEKHGKFKNIS